MRSAPAISFELRPSRSLIAASWAMLLLACVAIVSSAASFALQVLMIAVMAVGALPALRRQQRPRYVAISHDQGGWQLRRHDGEPIVARLREHGQLGPCLTLDFSIDRARWRCLLMPDMVDADTRRRLILLLASLQKTTPKPAPLA